MISEPVAAAAAILSCGCYSDRWTSKYSDAFSNLESDNAVLEVSGMDEETKESIFITEFSTKFDEETGNLQRGLGLTLVKDFVEQDYHGTVDVVTAPGKGAEFILTIPKSEIEDSK